MALRPEFDMHISLGSMLGIVIMLGGLAAFYFQVQSEASRELYEIKSRIGAEVAVLKIQVAQDGKDIERLANEYHQAWRDVSDRINSIDGRINDIKILLGPPKDGHGR